MSRNHITANFATSFKNTNGPIGLLGGAFSALDNAPNRSVHIKIHPRPRSLSESQQILQILRRYGEVEVYRHLKYDYVSPAPNTLLVVYKHAESAAKAITEKEIPFTYSHSSPTSTALSSPNASTASNDPPIYSHSLPFPRPAELTIRPAELLHLPFIQRQRYYWPVDERTGGDKPGEGLLGRLPDGLAGLADFDVMAPDKKYREREIASIVLDQNIRRNKWETLGQLWKKGVERREKLDLMKRDGREDT